MSLKPSFLICGLRIFVYQLWERLNKAAGDGKRQQIFRASLGPSMEHISRSRSLQIALHLKFISIARVSTASMSKIKAAYLMWLIIAMVDFRKCFIDVEVDWPDSVGDSRIFKTSRLNAMLVGWLTPFPTSRLVTGEHDNDEHIYQDIPAFILADSAYPNSKHIVTTFKVTETADEVINVLNKKLEEARYHVKNVFDILKGRFRIFQSPLETAVEDIGFVIVLISAVFILHNFLIDVQDTARRMFFAINFLNVSQVQNGSGMNPPFCSCIIDYIISYSMILSFTLHIQKKQASTFSQPASESSLGPAKL